MEIKEGKKEEGLGTSLSDEISSLISEIPGMGGGDEVVKPEEGAESEDVKEEEKKEVASEGEAGEESEEASEDSEGGEQRAKGEKKKEAPEPDDAGVGEPGETDEITALRERLEKQNKTIEELSAKIQPAQKVADKAEEPPAFEQFDISEEEFEELTTDREAFVNFFRKREEKLAKQIKDTTTSNTIRSLPAMVMRQVQYASTLREAVNDFWVKNSDLSPVKKTVGVVANEIVAEHPDYTIDQVFNEAGKRVRDMLGLKEKVKAPSNPAKKPTNKAPAFAKQRAGGSRGGDQQNLDKTIADEIDSLI